MARIKTIAARCPEDSRSMNMVLAVVKVDKDMGTMEATVVGVSRRAITMPKITHKCKLSNPVHTFSTHATSKTCTENRGSFKVLTRGWTSRESIILEIQCHKVKCPKTAKCCRQFKHQAAVAQMLQLTEDNRWWQMGCIASADKTTDRCRKIGRRRLERVC